jgi:hypothetical protein
MHEEENKRLVRRHLEEVVNTGDVTRTAEFIAAEQEWDFAKEYTGETGTVRWFLYPSWRSNGFVDFASALRPSEWTVAYAATRVESPQAHDVQLRIGSGLKSKSQIENQKW